MAAAARRPVRFQYFSDVHAEFRATDRKFIASLDERIVVGPRGAAPSCLLLAGDIGWPRHLVYREFLARVAARFDHVFLVAGNHEYYQAGCGGDNRPRKTMMPADRVMTMIENEIRAVTHKLASVVFLKDAHFDIPGTDVAVYGTTMWSDVAIADERYVEEHIGDYACIPGFTVGYGRRLFAESRTKLGAFLDACERDGKRAVVLTHHLPSYDLISAKYANERGNSAFASDLRDLADRPCVAAWVAGHTHAPCERGKFHVNPIGYPSEEQHRKPDFSKAFTL